MLSEVVGVASPLEIYANAKVRHHDPETAAALEAGDKKVLELDTIALAKIPAEPIFAEFVAAADAEPNVALQAKLLDVKAGKIVQVMASFYHSQGMYRQIEHHY